MAAIRTQAMLLGRMTAAGRIATFLRSLAARSTDPTGCIQLHMTHADIADPPGPDARDGQPQAEPLKRLGVIELPTPSRVRIMELDRLGSVAEAA